MIFHNKKSGFSLVEVLVAISILLLVLVGPLRIVSQSTNSTSYATEQAQAFFLAQEGLELVEQIRDNLQLEYINGSPNVWTRFGQTSAAGHCFTNYCAIMASSTGGPGVTGNNTPYVDVLNCTNPTAVNCRIYKRPATVTTMRDQYTHLPDGNELTPFSRAIQIGMVPSSGKPEGFWATSTVTWRTGSLSTGQQVQLVTYFANTYDSD